MSGPEFFQTRMGSRFFEGTMPRIVDALESLSTTLSSITALLQTWNARSVPAHGSVPAHDSVPAADAAGNLKPALEQLVREHLRSDTPERPGTDTLNFHETIVSALGIALHAAYQAGIAASLRQLRADVHDAQESR